MLASSQTEKRRHSSFAAPQPGHEPTPMRALARASGRPAHADFPACSLFNVGIPATGVEQTSISCRKLQCSTIRRRRIRRTWAVVSATPARTARSSPGLGRTRPGDESGRPRPRQGSWPLIKGCRHTQARDLSSPSDRTDRTDKRLLPRKRRRGDGDKIPRRGGGNKLSVAGRSPKHAGTATAYFVDGLLPRDGVKPPVRLAPAHGRRQRVSTRQLGSPRRSRSAVDIGVHTELTLPSGQGSLRRP